MTRHLTPLFALFLTALTLSACAEETTTTPAANASSPQSELTSMERGAILYKRCRACHTLGQGERNKVGPNLWNIFGSSAGGREDFNYSAAMTGIDIVWSKETMSDYLERPSEFIPGNRMSFAGLRKVEDREALIEYLRANTGADSSPG